MTLRSRSTKSRRLCLEHLESRANPSNFAVTVSGPNMAIVGDADANQLVIDGVVGDATKFTLSSTNGNSFNGDPGPFSTPTGIENITIKTLGGADSVTFSNAVAPISLAGNLSFDGGNDANKFSALNLAVGTALKITNGSNATGNDEVTLKDLNVGGAVTIKNGDGDTITSILRDSTGTSIIGNSLTVSNGTGADKFAMRDTHVGGNVTIYNGKGRADGVAGYANIANELNSANRSLIRGNVSVTYGGGNQSAGFGDGIFDTEVTGSVTFNHGSGNFLTSFDGFRTTLPVLIGGGLTLKGTGVNTVGVATLNWAQNVGMVVGGNFTSTSGGGNISLDRLEVRGSASLTSTGGTPVITGASVRVGQNLSIARNTNADTTLTNLEVGGELTIKSKTGGATTMIHRTFDGWNSIGGNVNITNRDGADYYVIEDTNVGGHLTVNSGIGDGTNEGWFSLYNVKNTTARSQIGGNIAVTFLNDKDSPGTTIYDAEVNGNVTFNYGTGTFASSFNDLKTGLPVLVHGGVSIKGTGPITVNIGTQNTNKGLIVDKTFKVTTGALHDVMNLRDLHVGGVATMALGDGANTVFIDDSTFNNRLTILTGRGADQINLDTLENTTQATTFKGPVLIRTGGGDDQLTRVGKTDPNQAISVWNTLVFDGGAGDDVTTGVPTHEFYPFGNSIQEV